MFGKSLGKRVEIVAAQHIMMQCNMRTEEKSSDFSQTTEPAWFEALQANRTSKLIERNST
jgi:hypothetical protein